MLHTIKVENTDEEEVKSAPAGEGEEVSASDSQTTDPSQTETPEQTALSALKNFSNEHVSVVWMWSNVVQGSLVCRRVT